LEESLPWRNFSKENCLPFTAKLQKVTNQLLLKVVSEKETLLFSTTKQYH